MNIKFKNNVFGSKSRSWSVFNVRSIMLRYTSGRRFVVVGNRIGMHCFIEKSSQSNFWIIRSYWNQPS